MKTAQAFHIYVAPGLQNSELVAVLAELGGSAKVIATGGQAPLVAGLTHVIQATDPLLTLDGLRLIYAQNAGER